MRRGWGRNITSLRGIKDAGDRRNRGTLGGPARRNARKHWDVRDFGPVSPTRSRWMQEGAERCKSPARQANPGCKGLHPGPAESVCLGLSGSERDQVDPETGTGRKRQKLHRTLP
jgi:hypothetical protein